MKTLAIAEAGNHWNSGDPLRAGRVLFEAIPANQRPEWAANTLQFAMKALDIEEAYLVRALNTARDTSRWKEGHKLLDSIRTQTLRLESKEAKAALDIRETRLLYLTHIAELVAKVSYNASDPVGPFDRDSGWYLAVLLSKLADLLEDDEFRQNSWAILTQLEN